MRILLCLSLLLSSHLHAQLQEVYYDAEWEVTTAKKAQFYSTVQKTDSGWLQKDYFLGNMQLQMTGLYADDQQKIKNGHFAWYHPNGSLSKRVVYRNNQEQGLLLSFFPDGHIKDSIFFNNGILKNVGLRWHHNGVLNDSLVYVNDSSIMQYSWFDNGIADGAVEDVFVYAPLHPAFDKVVIHLIENLPRWVPGMQHNRRIKTYHRQSVNFAVQ